MALTCRLDGDALIAFIELAIRGYTVRRLRELMVEQGHGAAIANLTDAHLINLYRDTTSKWQPERDQLDQDTRELYGLSRKLERVRRLIETAESIEALASTSPKWSGEYRRYLTQIQMELEPLGIEVRPGDAWADLLNQIANVGQGLIESATGQPTQPTQPTQSQSEGVESNVESMGKGDLGTAEADS